LSFPIQVQEAAQTQEGKGLQLTGTAPCWELH